MRGTLARLGNRDVDVRVRLGTWWVSLIPTLQHLGFQFQAFNHGSVRPLLLDLYPNLGNLGNYSNAENRQAGLLKRSDNNL
jgi:hypothetical protein